MVGLLDSVSSVVVLVEMEKENGSSSFVCFVGGKAKLEKWSVLLSVQALAYEYIARVAENQRCFK